jgi:hypothetical protein
MARRYLAVSGGTMGGGLLYFRKIRLLAREKRSPKKISVQTIDLYYFIRTFALTFATKQIF